MTEDKKVDCKQAEDTLLRPIARVITQAQKLVRAGSVESAINLLEALKLHYDEVQDIDERRRCLYYSGSPEKQTHEAEQHLLDRMKTIMSLYNMDLDSSERMAKRRRVHEPEGKKPKSPKYEPSSPSYEYESQSQDPRAAEPDPI